MDYIHSACVLSNSYVAILLRINKKNDSESNICQMFHVRDGVAVGGAKRSGEAIRVIKMSGESECVAMLSVNGEVEIFDSSGKSLGREDVTGCLAQGVSTPKYGYLLSMTLVDGNLYACGMRGQVYMRNNAGQWRLISKELCTEVSYERYFANIQGINSEKIVVDGLDGEMYVYNGHNWRRINSGTQAAIGEMAFLSDDEVFITSTQSTLLQGNFEIGFRPTKIGDADRAFLKICAYGGLLYIGSYDGLFIYDTNSKNFNKITISSDPIRTEVISLQIFDRKLWCFTVNAVHIFDGSCWSKFFSL